MRCDWCARASALLFLYKPPAVVQSSAQAHAPHELRQQLCPNKAYPTPDNITWPDALSTSAHNKGVPELNARPKSALASSRSNSFCEPIATRTTGKENNAAESARFTPAPHGVSPAAITFSPRRQLFRAP